MRPPLEHLPDCNYFHYCLQLNLYKYILESEYGMTVSAMYLGVVHPQTRPRVIEVPPLGAEVAMIVENEIATGRALPPLSGPDAPFVLL